MEYILLDLISKHMKVKNVPGAVDIEIPRASWFTNLIVFYDEMAVDKEE